LPRARRHRSVDANVEHRRSGPKESIDAGLVVVDLDLGIQALGESKQSRDCVGNPLGAKKEESSATHNSPFSNYTNLHPDLALGFMFAYPHRASNRIVKALDTWFW